MYFMYFSGGVCGNCVYFKCTVAMAIVMECLPTSSNHIHSLPPTHMQKHTLMKGTLIKYVRQCIEWGNTYPIVYIP